METWERDDGRFYCIELGRDLFGPAVLIASGGARVARWRSIPVASVHEGEAIRAQLARRRELHGYRRKGE